MRHAGTHPIKTPRLTLRRLIPADAEMMFVNLTSDENVTRFLRWDAHRTIDETKAMVQGWVDSYCHDSTYYWGIFLKSGEMIGSVGVTITSELDLKGELGYKIGSRYWNRGYTTEAASTVVDYMFRRTDIERIDAYCSIENPASRKVMGKIGMSFEGTLRHYYKTRDGFHDCTLYGILRRDWEKKRRLKFI